MFRIHLDGNEERDLCTAIVARLIADGFVDVTPKRGAPTRLYLSRVVNIAPIRTAYNFMHCDAHGELSACP